MIVQVSGVEIDADSRTTATVNRSGLRLDAVEAGQLPERVARSVVRTSGSLPSCQQAQSIGSQCRPSQTNPSAKRRRTSQSSPSPEIQLGTRGDATEAVCTSATESRSRVCEVARPSPQESVEEGCGQTHKVDGKTTATEHVRPASTCTTTHTARERAGALTFPSSCLDVGVPRWVPVNTHSTPVRTSVWRLWVAQSTNTTRALTSNQTEF